MKAIILILFISLWSTSFIQAQNHTFRAEVIGNDTLPVVNLPSFQVNGQRFISRRLNKQYRKLQRDVKIVYPYAKLAGVKLQQCYKELEGVNSEFIRKQKMKKVEQELKEEYSGELSNLTVKQGLILIKLIDRETGSSSFDVVKELRGVFSAFFWQQLARLFGHNLKVKYDPENEDKLIEEIVQQIELGNIPVFYKKRRFVL